MTNRPETAEEMRVYLSANPPKPQLPWHRVRAQFYFVTKTAEACHKTLKDHPNHWFADAANARSLFYILPPLQTQVRDLVKFMGEDFPGDTTHRKNALFQAARGAIEMLDTAFIQLSTCLDQVAVTIIDELDKRARGSASDLGGDDYFAGKFKVDVKRLKDSSDLGDELRDVSEGISCLAESFVEDPYAYREWLGVATGV